MTKLGFILVGVLCAHTAVADKNYAGGKGATWDCTKDPVVNINHGRGKYTFKGTCTTINLNGGQSTLTIASVGTLNVNAAQNKITIGTVDAINVNGAGNTISYKTAKSADGANVKDTGTGNTIAQTK